MSISQWTKGKESYNEKDAAHFLFCAKTATKSLWHSSSLVPRLHLHFLQVQKAERGLGMRLALQHPLCLGRNSIFQLKSYLLRPKMWLSSADSRCVTDQPVVASFIVLLHEQPLYINEVTDAFGYQGIYGGAHSFQSLVRSLYKVYGGTTVQPAVLKLAVEVRYEIIC